MDERQMNSIFPIPQVTCYANSKFRSRRLNTHSCRSFAYFCQKDFQTGMEAAGILKKKGMKRCPS